MSKAIKAAAKAIQDAWRSGANPTDADLAQAAISAYLTALAEDDATVERVARAMHKQSRPLSNPDKLQPKPRGQVGMEPMWKMYEPMARAALRALKGSKP